MSERGMRAMLLSPRAPPREPATKQAAEFRNDLRRELRIVDMRRHANETARRRLSNGCFKCAKQFLVCTGICKRPPGRIERRHDAFRHKEWHRAVHAVQPPLRAFSSGVVRINVTVGL